MCAGRERMNIDVLARIEIRKLLTKVTSAAGTIYIHFQLVIVKRYLSPTIISRPELLTNELIDTTTPQTDSHNSLSYPHPHQLTFSPP